MPENGAGLVEGFDDGEGFDPDEVVTFHDEDGNERRCVVLAVVEHGGKEYAMLAEADKLGDDADDASDGELELFLFRYEVDDDDTELFSYIEDEATYDAVRTLCEGLMG